MYFQMHFRLKIILCSFFSWLHNVQSWAQQCYSGLLNVIWNGIAPYLMFPCYAFKSRVCFLGCSIILRAHSQLIFLLLNQSSYSAAEIQGTILDLVSEWNFCSSVCDLWFHWNQLQCDDAVLHPQELQISVYNQWDPSSPATVPVSQSSAVVILLVPSQGKLSGEWLRAEHFGLHWQCCCGWLLSSFPFLINFFKKSASRVLHNSILGTLMRAFVRLSYRLCFESTGVYGQYKFKEFLASGSHPGAAGRYLPFQLFVALCWMPGQRSDPGVFHCNKKKKKNCFCSIEYQKFVKGMA